ncbi:helix-turn-helix transcriptional regulator [Mangrovihabitans endophyticus]|uniref:Transcriptional regulator, AlpA family n=1 Tax=Mangrovihabitans endophyticus TaxID=1751298 RepID=A0A8J3C5D8_9ACTN|nr:DNA-binding protein [Mangrovihabitans endophyticus]GGL21502.1 hypothetical protein GCM10012284_65120 [Mangrovihabitans endophyticus]
MKSHAIRLAGPHEVCLMLGGVCRQRLNQLAAKPGFPPPLITLEMGRVWLAPEVEAWIAAHPNPRAARNRPT